MSQYADLFREFQPNYDPRLIEGWVRVEYPALDHLSRDELRRYSHEAAECIEVAGTAESEAVAASIGL